jgi:hypothetical protein
MSSASCDAAATKSYACCIDVDGVMTARRARSDSSILQRRSRAAVNASTPLRSTR